MEANIIVTTRNVVQLLIHPAKHAWEGQEVEGRPSEVALRLEIQKAESGPNPKLHLGKPKGMHVLSDQ